MKKKKAAKKKVSVKKAKAKAKSKPVKKKKLVKKAATPKKKKVVKKAKPLKKAKPAKKVKAAKKAKPKKAAAPKKAKAVKKAASPKKAAPKKAKAVKKAPVKKVAVPKKPPVEKVSLPATPAVADLQRQKAVFTLCSCQYAEPGSIQQTAAELNVDPHCIIKTLVMEDELGKPMLVLVHGDQDVSEQELAATIGAQQITLCNPELTEVHTGYETGTTSPFGIPKVMPVFMEKSIAMLPEIYLGAGQRGLLAKMSSAELIDRLKPFMVSVAK